MLLVPTSRSKIAFISTEDWFFASHFLPMIEAVRQVGAEPVVITRVRNHRAVIEAAGARVIPFEADRSSLNPGKLTQSIYRLARLLRSEKIDAVHCIALRSILIGAPAAAFAGIDRRVFAVTGGGFLGARKDLAGKFANAVLQMPIKAFQGPKTHYLFENDDDPAQFGLRADAANVTIIGGAGVDPEHYFPEPLLTGNRLEVALVARMLWSKGVDLAVEATGIARRAGHDVKLTLFGEPDPANPRAISRGMLEEWAQRDGIEWQGFVRDVRKVWSAHHVACLPSRGGEGLPRTLLEAAACGRAMITTDVPGCRHFVRHGVDGLVVSPNDAKALAYAMIKMASDRGAVARMGQSARGRIFQGYRSEDIIKSVSELYTRLLTPA